MARRTSTRSTSAAFTAASAATMDEAAEKVSMTPRAWARGHSTAQDRALTTAWLRLGMRKWSTAASGHTPRPASREARAEATSE